MNNDMEKLIAELRAFEMCCLMPEKNTQNEAIYLCGYADAKARMSEILSRFTPSTDEGGVVKGYFPLLEELIP